MAQVSHALTANKVPHLHPRDAKHFDAAITQFKLPAEQDLGPSSAAGRCVP
jgi:hypothetical protein